MAFKVERIDEKGSFNTKFIIHTSNTEAQEFYIPTWDADDFEAKVKGFTNIDFNTWKDKEGKKDARTDK